jgi:hypothetical protein
VIGESQEDRWSDGGAHGLLAAVPFDGDACYENGWAKFSACSDRTEPSFNLVPMSASFM